jgi:hypothetical protein
MSEVLTDTALLTKDFFGRRSYVGCLGIEAEFLVDPCGEIQQRLGKRPGRHERLGCIFRKLVARPDSR